MTVPDDKRRVDAENPDFSPLPGRAPGPRALPLSALARGWADTPPNRVAVALEAARREGRAFVDLVNATPHENGLVFPEATLREAVERAFATPEVRSYRPDPRGRLAAREAIAGYYRRRGVDADPGRILLTPGTSQAYFYALRLLTEPGDEILIPSPGYPLFDDIAALCGVRTRKYHLAAPRGEGRETAGTRGEESQAARPSHRLRGWRPDLDEIAFQCTPRTRVIMVVSPHNPTGCVFSAEELEGLARICRERNLAVVFDEVFCEFLAGEEAATESTGQTESDGKESGDQEGGLTPKNAKSAEKVEAPARRLVPQSGESQVTGRRLPRPDPAMFPLAVTLNGFSKMFSLPGWKVGWMKVAGSARGEIERFSRALEFLSDVFLPVPDLIQAVIPEVLERGDPAVSAGLAREYGERRRLALGSLRCEVAAPEGGVYLCGRLSMAEEEEERKKSEEPSTKGEPDGATECEERQDREDDEVFCLRALRDHGVFVHPGYYYDFPAGYFVFTCVARPAALRDGIERLNRALEAGNG